MGSTLGAALTAFLSIPSFAVGADAPDTAAAAARASIVALRQPAAPAEGDGSGAAGDDLGPTTAPPWNPPHAIHPRRTWERVVLAPQRLATLPLSGVGWLADRALLVAEQTAFIPKAAYVSRVIPERTGLRFGAAALGSRTGLGLRTEVATPFFGGFLRNLVTLSHSASTRHYHRTSVQVLGQPLVAQYDYEWRPQDRFYGRGMESGEDDLTQYASQFDRLRLGIGHAWNSIDADLPPRTRFALWIGPRSIVTSRGREPDEPSVETRFPGAVGPLFERRVEQLAYGGSIASDWRVGEPHWSHGWRAQIEVERYDTPVQAIAMRTARHDGPQFTRTTVEIETGYSFLRDPRTLRVLGRMIDQGVTSGADRMAITDLASLGGRDGLWGYAPGRFHDIDLLLGRLSWVFPLVRRFEIDLHVEGGGVFSDLWENARVVDMRTSFGAALRGRSKSSPVGSIGIDASREGARLRFTLGSIE